MQLQVIQQYCKQLRIPTIGSQFRGMAESAGHEQQAHLDYLEALLSVEMEERGTRRGRAAAQRSASAEVQDGRGVELQFRARISASKLKELAEGGYVGRAEPVLFIGDSGDRQNASAHGTARGRLPTKAARTLHHGNAVDQRACRSPASARARPRTEEMVAL